MLWYGLVSRVGGQNCLRKITINYKLFVSQSEVQPNLIVIPSHRFSHALPRLHDFTMSVDRFIGLSMSFVIDETSLSIGFGFTAIN